MMSFDPNSNNNGGYIDHYSGQQGDCTSNGGSPAGHYGYGSNSYPSALQQPEEESSFSSPAKAINGIWNSLTTSSSSSTTHTSAYQPPRVYNTPASASNFGSSSSYDSTNMMNSTATTMYQSPSGPTATTPLQFQTPLSYQTPSSDDAQTFFTPPSSSTQPTTNGLFLGLDQSTPATTTSGIRSYRTRTKKSSSDPFDNFSGSTTTNSFSSFRMDEKKEDYEEHTTSHYGTSSNDSYSLDNAFDQVVDEVEEDREFKRAQEAALYAQDLLQKQAAEKKRLHEQGPLGFGILPKAQGFMKQTTENMHIPAMSSKNNDINIQGNTISVDDVDPAETGRSNSELPPWYSADRKSHDATQFGLSNRDDTNQQQQRPSKTAGMVGASVIGGVAGLVTLGPLVGVVAAGSAAYVSAKDGTLGNVMRGAGSLVVKAGSAAKSFDEKHNVVGKAATGVVKGVGWVAKTVQGNDR